VANHPAILLADEPTGEIDSESEVHVVDLLREEARRGGAVLVVSHSIAVTEAADRVLRILDGSVLS
jgi:putative ABC transport system ATP-binding protein